MAIFKTGIDVISANENQIDSYYQSVAEKINLLFNKYDTQGDKSQHQTISASQLKGTLSIRGFFKSTPLKLILMDQKQQYIPHEIVQTYRNIISDAPANIKAFIYKKFIFLLTIKSWSKSLSEYFEHKYNYPSDGTILLDDLKDFSLAYGIYRATFRLRSLNDEKVTVFLKRSKDTRIYNEILYISFQKEFLATAYNARLPYLLSGKTKNDSLLLSPLINGITSDAILSLLAHKYRTSTSNNKIIFKQALETLIEAFIDHAALGDLLGKNDRHLANSLIDIADDDIAQNIHFEKPTTPDPILSYAQNITKNHTKAISMINIDAKWLLEKNSADWALIDIDYGLSEINRLSMLPELNHSSLGSNRFFENRKKIILYYFNLYCQTQKIIIEKKSILFSTVKDLFPSSYSQKKLEHLAQRINLFEKNTKPAITTFKRYLLNYRIRLLYKEVLFELYQSAHQSKNKTLMNELANADLLIYLPPIHVLKSFDPTAFVELQCFRGVMSKKDKINLSYKNETTWESLSFNINTIVEKFNGELFNSLIEKTALIRRDTDALLNELHTLFC